MSSLVGEKVGQREGKVDGHEETDMGQMWVNQRVPSDRNPGPLDVLLGQGANFEGGQGHLIENVPRRAGGQSSEPETQV